jgi:hypothetical protein
MFGRSSAPAVQRREQNVEENIDNWACVIDAFSILHQSVRSNVPVFQVFLVKRRQENTKLWIFVVMGCRLLVEDERQGTLLILQK